MLIVGLTGGIGCGKSSAADLFSTLGVAVIDTDVISHQLVEPGQPLLEQLFSQFGDDLRQADGSLNRELLRERVFADDTLRNQLESLMHPAIHKEMIKQLNQVKAPYCILVIPLLLESNRESDCDRILVIDCSKATQQRRVLQRPGLSSELFEAIVNAQCSRQQRLSKADDIIYNDTDDVATLREQVLLMHQQYLDLSSNA